MEVAMVSFIVLKTGKLLSCNKGGTIVTYYMLWDIPRGGVVMKKAFLAVPVLVLFSVSLVAAPALQKLWSSTKNFFTAESVMYDAKRQVVYVSCINGQPTVKDGNGYIAKLNVKGEILNLYWTRGLDAPKGMALTDEYLYVTDIDRFHRVSLKSGRIVETVSIPGARFLNDMAVGPGKNIFITDMMTNKLHVFNENQELKSYETRGFRRPNGLFMGENHILYMGTAQGIVAMDTRKPGSLSLYLPHRGGIDGLKMTGKDSFLVSDWKGKVTRITPKGKHVLMDTSGKKNAADFEYISSKKLLLVPTFFDNRVEAYRLR